MAWPAHSYLYPYPVSLLKRWACLPTPASTPACLPACAQVMNDELARQNRVLDVLDDKASATTGRIDNMNKNSQLREFRWGG